jgi:RNA polymerase sigma-70 factor (ECF subfamily)
MTVTDPNLEPADAELLARLASDRDALELFYRRHVAAVAAFVARRVPDADAVADVVSDTFLAALRGAAGFDARRSPDTARFWLLGIARREVADHHRANGRQEALSRRDRHRPALSEDETARIDELIDAQRVAPDIQAGLDGLSAPLRDAFVLVAVDGFTQNEAAQVLDISPAALRARLARARLALRRHLHRRTDGHPTSLALATTQLPGGTDGL